VKIPEAILWPAAFPHSKVYHVFVLHFDRLAEIMSDIFADFLVAKVKTKKLLEKSI